MYWCLCLYFYRVIDIILFTVYFPLCVHVLVVDFIRIFGEFCCCRVYCYCCRCVCWISCHPKCSTFVASKYGSNAGPRSDKARQHLSMPGSMNSACNQQQQTNKQTAVHTQPHTTDQAHAFACSTSRESALPCNHNSFECFRGTFFCSLHKLQLQLKRVVLTESQPNERANNRSKPAFKTHSKFQLSSSSPSLLYRLIWFIIIIINLNWKQTAFWRV